MTQCSGSTTQQAAVQYYPGQWPFQGKVLTICRICRRQIALGSDTFPYEGLRWVHLTCAKQLAASSGTPLLPPVCKHWQQRGFCLYKDKCFYRHPEREALPTAQVWPARKPTGEKSGKNEDDAGSNHDRRIRNRGPGKRNSVRKGFRTGAFRRFLLDTFGQAQLASGSGVLDVAGGKGELSFELLNLNGIRSTVVDPRPLQLDRFRKWLKVGMYHRNRLFQQWICRPHAEFTAAENAEGETPLHLRMCDIRCKSGAPALWRGNTS
ncbi:hypothetical protein WJX72_011228 [[Myrmecia] bisecta]|uniref:C3H1-type domain-containing protein n=1 Tax=[Myrmecia] bisecta TaxID=41462 RepID=A0AAW1PM07_9CHLO